MKWLGNDKEKWMVGAVPSPVSAATGLLLPHVAIFVEVMEYQIVPIGSRRALFDQEWSRMSRRAQTVDQ